MHHLRRIVNNAPQCDWLSLPFFESVTAGNLQRIIREYGSVSVSLKNAAIVAITALSMNASTASAQDDAPAVGGDFTFKRVGVPQKSVGKRITVQIDPNAEVYRLTPGSEPRRPGDPRPDAARENPFALEEPAQPSGYEWYWQLVSPAASSEPAGRLRDAIAAVQNNATKVRTPRLQALQRITEDHGIDILTATIGTQVSPALVLAVISVESAGQGGAVSSAGAQGLMQLIPATAKRFGVTDSFDPKQNIRGGVAYLDWLLKNFDGDAVLAIAAYNAGEGAITKHEGVPPYAETRDYVPKVLAAWTVARGLCSTPPELLSDGCVFVGPRVVSGE